jgi:AraC family transcriptional regulator
MVFPRTSVTITHAGKAAVVADPNIVMFYNRGQIYTRGKLSDKGDLCEWFSVDPGLVADALRPFDEYVDDHPCKPFSFINGPSDPHCYLTQRLVVDIILQNQRADPLFIEETVLLMLRRVIENVYEQRGIFAGETGNSMDREVADALQKMLATRFNQKISLEQIARDLNYSPFHLCRIFHKHIGQSIHQYLRHLRLRTSLEYVTQANTDLSRLAIDLGFSSHSHFTEAFRKTFGTAPSSLRNASLQSIGQFLSKISIA